MMQGKLSQLFILEMLIVNNTGIKIAEEQIFHKYVSKWTKHFKRRNTNV